MARKYGTATREIFFKKPWDFESEFNIEELSKLPQYGGKIKLGHIDSLKIKLEIPLSEFKIEMSGTASAVTCSERGFNEALAACEKRRTNQIHGLFFISDDKDRIAVHCPPMGDFYAFE